MESSYIIITPIYLKYSKIFINERETIKTVIFLQQKKKPSKIQPKQGSNATKTQVVTGCGGITKTGKNTEQLKC